VESLFTPGHAGKSSLVDRMHDCATVADDMARLSCYDSLGSLQPAKGAKAPARNAVDMDGAGAALGDAATVFGAGQADGIPQHPQQRGVGINIDLMGLSIDAESSHFANLP
jgi:hypothetical protein